MKQPKDINIFIVDDNPFCLHLYETQLQNNGFEQITIFSDAEACLTEATTQPDVVFVDHDMSPMNGIELMKAMKIISPQTMVVFVSAQRHVKKAIEALRNGANEYIVKDGSETTQMLQTVHQLVYKIN
jgi:polysaccharide export outer membrane protein